MKVVIGSKTYTKIKNLSFAPQTDITGNEMVINSFVVDIMTSDTISVGGTAVLYDDRNILWASYWLIEAERLDKETVRVEAQSVLRILDRTTMPPVMYSSQSVSSIVAAIFGGLSYKLDSSFSSKTISGYCPEQTARERFQWICFVIGAWVKTYFTDKIEILPIAETVALVPMNKTYWKPTITYSDYVTAVNIIAYSYTKGTPANTDSWVQVGDDYYIETQQEFTITNPEVPSTANENVVKIDGVTIIGQSNISEVMSFLSKYYFKRIEVDADVINNAEFSPGDKVTVSVDDETRITGYVKSASFTFGLQAKATLKITQTDLTSNAKLTINRLYNGNRIWQDVYYFPQGYQYAIQNIYVDETKSGMRRIYYPLADKATGTISSGTNVNNQNYDVALQYSDGILRIYSVDEVEQKDEIVEIS